MQQILNEIAGKQIKIIRDRGQLITNVFMKQISKDCKGWINTWGEKVQIVRCFWISCQDFRLAAPLEINIFEIVVSKLSFLDFDQLKHELILIFSWTPPYPTLPPNSGTSFLTWTGLSRQACQNFESNLYYILIHNCWPNLEKYFCQIFGCKN